MENDNAELYGGGYDNYYENGGWYQDEYGEWYQDPAYAENIPNGSIPNGMSGTKATLSNHNVIQSGTTSANNKSMQNQNKSHSHKDARYIICFSNLIVTSPTKNKKKTRIKLKQRNKMNF